MVARGGLRRSVWRASIPKTESCGNFAGDAAVSMSMGMIMVIWEPFCEWWARVGKAQSGGRWRRGGAGRVEAGPGIRTRGETEACARDPEEGVEDEPVTPAAVCTCLPVAVEVPDMASDSMRGAPLQLTLLQRPL